MNIVAQRTITVLAVVLETNDKEQIQRASLDRKWNLQFAASFQEAQAVLREAAVDVIISDSHIGEEHSWRDLLNAIRDTMEPAALIVADRHADEAFWIEVLNEGGFDVLAKPFDWSELMHAVNVACSLRLKAREDPHKHRGTTQATAA
jgi:DNA-binding NtrC family response regulator